MEAQNLAAQEAYKQGMFGSAAGFSQAGSQALNQQFANLANLQSNQQQSQQAYNQMLAQGAQQNAASQNAINAARKSGKTVVLPKEKSPASWTPMKKLGGVAVKKKMAAGGMSMGTKQCGPGDGSCKEVKSGNIFQRWGDKMRRNKANNFNKPKLRRTKV
jgi:hypothetical protein